MKDKIDLAEKLITAIGAEDEKEISSVLQVLSLRERERSLKNIKLLLEKGAFKGMEGEMINSAVQSPDPDLALNNAERLVGCLPVETIHKALGKPDLMSDLFTLCGGSQFLSNILFRYSSLFDWLFMEGNISESLSFEDKLSRLRGELEGVRDMKALQKVLRNFKHRDYLRIGARDLTGAAGMAEVAAEISDLAAVSLQGAYEVISSMLKSEYGAPLYKDPQGNEKEADFVVLGMGKLGGRELNFSSDIDLIFLYTTEKGETTGIADESGNLNEQISIHEFFTKMGKMIVKALNEVTEDGFVFRVDMDLRPEGKSGDLACSLRSAEIYYESWGQTWERSAMLKARPLAGDIALGENFLQLLNPFMYRRFLDYTAIEEIRAMKRKIDASIARDDQSFTNIKLGTGGIREIEFFIQALQLINSGKNAKLREKNSLRALKKLAKEGLISDDECQKLSHAYIFLRTVEHRLQIFQERQTHTLPTKEEAMEMLARRVGYREDPLPEFLKDHSMHTANVKEIYSSLFHEAADKLEEETSPELLELLEGLLNKDEAVERLSNYGFKEPANAFQNLSLLWNGPPFAHFTEKSRGVLRRVAPYILK
ncbi:MAG: bifunctional [glutamate--ammonia ligase]-adenylyl-L-tyrosine phosphorylase/[glutamate--ammonia-ligase] adenylyltransferase, partial [Deltaproteobacteria bacterium]|nr:bifunctional [glutamate--ammonia ligase]-adenylyl-L-tyrosine phosphorylase/[glutamate--ammonia-ligase] adenylyltransferase [Deltaproteobacteria bacterium]